MVPNEEKFKGQNEQIKNRIEAHNGLEKTYMEFTIH
jgi:hypothetical protein